MDYITPYSSDSTLGVKCSLIQFESSSSSSQSSSCGNHKRSRKYRKLSNAILLALRGSSSESPNMEIISPRLIVNSEVLSVSLNSKNWGIFYKILDVLPSELLTYSFSRKFLIIHVNYITYKRVFK